MTTTTTKLMTTDRKGSKAGSRVADCIEINEAKKRTFTHKRIYDDIKHFIQSIDLFFIWTPFHSFTTNNFPFRSMLHSLCNTEMQYTLCSIDVLRLHLHASGVRRQASGAVRLFYHIDFNFHSGFSYSVWKQWCTMYNVRHAFNSLYIQHQSMHVCSMNWHKL